jgi:hypothetical protein
VRVSKTQFNKNGEVEKGMVEEEDWEEEEDEEEDEDEEW